MGKLRPGDRVMSDRRLADLTGINHKTIHRAYTALAREGILEVRPGSGTFVTERRSVAQDLPPTPGLLGALDRCRNEATRLGLSPAVLSRFLSICLEDGLRGITVGLVECNWEQITMIGRDLQRSLGVEVRPILLDDLEREPTQVLASVGSVVTTDCHYSQVADHVEPHGVPTYTVTLDQRFPRVVLRAARHNELVMVVRDPRFGRVFVRLLKQLDDDAGLLQRIRFVDEQHTMQTLRTAKPGTWAYFSPAIPPRLHRSLPQHVRRMEHCWHIEPSALESVRAGLALGQALIASTS
jgi:GntR family transcriptional regulator